MAESLSTVDGILKDYYTDVVREQTNTFSKVQEIIEKVTDTVWEGRKAIEDAIMSYNEGVGAIAENANLPAAGNFQAAQFNIPMRYIYASFEMTKQAIDAAKTNKGAFKNTFKTSMETTIRNVKRERARMLWHAGTGVLALVNGAVVASTTVNVDAPGNVAGSFGGARFLRPNMLVAFTDGATITAVKSIVSVASNGQSIVVDSNLTCNDNLFIVRVSLTTSTSLNDTGYNKEPLGLLGMVDDGTYVATLNGLSRTTWPQLKSRVDSSVGALSLDMLQKNLDVVDQQGDGQIDFFAAEHSVIRAYAALLEADRRYSAGDLKSPDGGTVRAKGKYLTFGDITIYPDKFAPYDMLFGLSKGDFKRYVQNEGEWADDSGAILRQTAGKDTWNALYRIWENYQLSRPNTCFRADGITTNKVWVPSY